MAEQEDFASMLDDYIDPEEIREIVEEDLKEEREEKQHRSGHSTEAKFPEEMTISIPASTAIPTAFASPRA